METTDKGIRYNMAKKLPVGSEFNLVVPQISRSEVSGEVVFTGDYKGLKSGESEGFFYGPMRDYPGLFRRFGIAHAQPAGVFGFYEKYGLLGVAVAKPEAYRALSE